MKKLIPLLCLVVGTPTLASHYDVGCRRKLQILETKISIARRHGNVNQQAGLEAARGRVRARCEPGHPARTAHDIVNDERQERIWSDGLGGDAAKPGFEERRP
ncbi:DUF1090 family protein [Burkholderia multivorans]|uniref:DUF1090 family protein n=1 Tax=Burkholderia multivorans TaxID=87883 RepID=UPI0019083E23|nr:DUF1090 family protein [Burkholderia multivorans]MBJ9938851.1 DUF1090 family protein [Burkholderia multivorans]MBU9287175.1 DUF1090 domain-containing protein [Burkholderia multivorans]